MTLSIASQMPVVPQIVMPPTAQAVSTASVALVGLVALGAAIVFGWRQRTPLYVLVLLGGMIASINEPIVDLLGGCLHPQTGGWTVFSTFDRPIPVWAVIAYALFFGAVPLIVLALMRGGHDPRKRFLQSVAAIFGANLLIELPILQFGVYVYYGQQPFKAFGLFPLHWLFINGLAAALIAVVLYRWSAAFLGARLLALLIVPTAIQFGAAAVGIPVFSAYNSDFDGVWKWIASAATMAIGSIAIVAVSNLVPPHLQVQVAKHMSESEPGVADSSVKASR